MRQLTSDELPLVSFLFERAQLAGSPAGLKVKPMNDGGMGSLTFAPITKSRKFGSTAAECTFCDQDGVAVTAVLNLDQKGEPFELDVFKADFNALKQWPSRDVLLTRVSTNGLP